MTDMELGPAGEHREQVSHLLAETTAALESDERAFSLVTHLPVLDDAPLRIAVAGPHNAGKSMLIAALLGLPREQVEAITGAVPLTDAIMPYEWSGCTLLDLPGTLSGLDAHDAVATAGVRRADLLLLVTSVELPGESETAQIRHLLLEEGFARRVLVVLNKCNSEDNDPDVVRAEMLDRLSPFPWIEPLFADAKDYVDANNADGLTQEDRDAYREDSGIDPVASALNRLAVERGTTARLQAVCHELRRISLEASELWAPSPEQETQEITADRIRAAFDDARRELTEATDDALETLAAQIESAGNRLAGAVSEEDASVDKRSAEVADEDVAKATVQYESVLNRVFPDVLIRLDNHLETAVENWERYSADLDAVAPGVDGGQSRRQQRLFVDGAAQKAVDTAVRKAQEKLDAFVKGGVRQGSQAHDLAKRLKAVRGGDPAKPYEHINKAADFTKVGKRVSQASEFLQPLVDVKGIVDGILRAGEARKQRNDIRSRYTRHAADVTASQRAATRGFIDARLAPRRDAVAAILDDAEETTRARTEAQAMWHQHAKQASALAALIDKDLAQ